VSRPSLLSRIVTCVVSGGLAATCGDPQSRNPARPSAAFLSAVEIVGPDSIAPGESAQFVAYVRLNDGTRKTPTPESGLRWRSSNSAVVRLEAVSGLATAMASGGESFVTATLNSRQATMEVIIVPAGTFRLVGRVMDEEYPTAPVPGARIEVLPGGASTVSDNDGRYRLYGVPPDAELRISASGYSPSVQVVQLAKHATQDFRIAATNPRPNLAGAYEIAIDVTGNCSGLTADLQHRRYEAVITQDGVKLDVRLTEPRFRIDFDSRGDRFIGEARPGGATFDLPNDFYDYYGFYTYGYPNVVEKLPDGTFLVIGGRVLTTGSASGLSGLMNEGYGLLRYDSKFPSIGRYLGGCDLKSAIQFTFTPR
jgi:hypothetical protein